MQQSKPIDSRVILSKQAYFKINLDVFSEQLHLDTPKGQQNHQVI